jgi:hypothetical protein
MFCIDVGVVPALDIVIKMCRDREVRREALRLLRSYPRMEGVWDSALIAEIGQWIVGVEEEGMERDFIPEYARVRLTKVEADIPAKRAKLECARKAGREGGLLIQQSTIHW